MAETKKVLELKFNTADNKQTTLSIINAKEDMSKDAVKQAMEGMVSSGAFATNKGVAYSGAHSAAYVERSVTTLFNSENA